MQLPIGLKTEKTTFLKTNTIFLNRARSTYEQAVTLDAATAEEYVPPPKEVDPKALESATNLFEKSAERLTLNPPTKVRLLY